MTILFLHVPGFTSEDQLVRAAAAADSDIEGHDVRCSVGEGSGGRRRELMARIWPLATGC